MVPDLILSKHNEVYAKLICERHILKELSEYFTFFVPGYTFVPAYRNKIWDGKIRLVNTNSNTIYLGLLKYIEEFCEERGYKYEYDETRPDLQDEFSNYHCEKFAQSLNLHSLGKPIGVREHQVKAFVNVMQNRRALLLSPTASGKSLIIYLIFRQLLDYQYLKGLIIVPTTSLVEQLFSDFVDYSSETDFGVNDTVHRIYQGKDKHSDKKLIISTWQSIHKMPAEYFEQFDYVIGDEAHLFKAQSLISILTSCINTKYRIGLTGTLDGTKCFDGNTNITTKYGITNIKDIKIGDEVLSYNEQTKKTEYKKVLKIFNNGTRRKMLKITVNGKQIITTHEHLFYTKNRGWVKAKYLKTTDTLYIEPLQF